jgi:hypothetical protein
MLDPSLATYFDSDLEMAYSTYGGSWEYTSGSLANTPASANVYTNNAPLPPVYFDLWATMTVSWAGEV